MYFENLKKSYYRFPSKNSVTDFDARIPYYFPTKNNYANDDMISNYLDTSSSYQNESNDLNLYDNTF